MASKKELVEAYSFSRRRLVTAFVSGAPGGREVEPARPGRTLIGGIALSVLLLAGAAVTGIFAGRTAVDWDSQGLVVSKQTGQLYVIPEDGGDLYPVINIVSARLILGEEVEPTAVEDEEILTRKPGDERGILGAPSLLPPIGDLLNSGWTACTDSGTGIMLSVEEEPGADELTSGAFVVTTGKDEFYLLAQSDPTADGPGTARSYQLPSGDRTSDSVRDNVLTGLGLPISKEAVRVSDQFLGLFPQGGDISKISMGPGADNRARAVTDGARSWLKVGPKVYELDPFSLAVFEAVSGNSAQQGQAPQTPLSSSPFEDAQWPTARPRAGLGGPCAVLQAEAGRAPLALLAQSPDGEATPAEVGRNDRQAVVEAGHGALVRSGAWEDTEGGELFLVDTNAVRYPLVGATALPALGYSDVETPVVPDTWVELLTPGTELSSERALCPPDFGRGAGGGGGSGCD